MKNFENTANARFTQGLLQLLLLSLFKKHLNEHLIYCIYNLIISYWKKFQKLIRFLTQSYLSLLNLFLFLSRFSVSRKSLNNYFFRRFAYKSQQIFSVDKLFYMVFYSFLYILLLFTFFSIQAFQGPSFSGSWFFWVQLFKGSGFSGSGSRFQK